MRLTFARVAGWVVLPAMAASLGGVSRAQTLEGIQVKTLDRLVIQPGSPLAAEGDSLYAVAEGQGALLRAQRAVWERLALRQTLAELPGGMAATRSTVFLSQPQQRAILAVNVAAGSVADLVRGAPFVRPTALALGDVLLVADPGAHALFGVRLSPGGKPIEVFEVLSDLPAATDYFVAAEGNDFVLSIPDHAALYQPSTYERGVALVASRRLSRPAIRATSTGRLGERDDAPEPGGRFPSVQRPGALLLVHGTLFLIDQASGRLFATPRSRWYPTEVVVSQERIFKPSQMAAGTLGLWVLDSGVGLVRSLPPLSQVEFTLGDRPGEALDQVYSILAQSGALPMRTLSPPNGAARVAASELLRMQGVSIGPPSRWLMDFVCILNRAESDCTALGGTAFAAPDVPRRVALDIEVVETRDLVERTVGEMADSFLLDPESSQYRSEEALWALNGRALEELAMRGAPQQKTPSTWGPFQGRLRSMRPRDFPPGFRLNLPRERILAYAVVPTSLLQDAEALPNISSRLSGFRWLPLGERASKGYSVAASQPSPSPLPSPDLTGLKRAWAQLLDSVNYWLPGTGKAETPIGVAEAIIDPTHPDLQASGSSILWAPAQPFGLVQGPPVSGPSPLPSPRMLEALDDKVDHGTAVLGVLASQGGQSGIEGLFPSGAFVQLDDRDPELGKGVAQAFKSGVRLFNLSRNFENRKDVDEFRMRVVAYKDALFVVAAGNELTDRKPICEAPSPYPAYPVCEGWRRNVVIVAATDLKGTALLGETSKFPGSNFSKDFVHIAAPGEGFPVLAANNSYSWAFGTSMATPIVTAAAAALMAQGVSDPWLIKQRLISTADFRGNLTEKVRAASFLNFKRAVQEPRRASLDGSIVEVNRQQSITLAWPEGTRTLLLADLRRLVRGAGAATYRAIYYDSAAGDLIVRDDVEPPTWKIRYRELQENGQPGPPRERPMMSIQDYVGPVS